jgi:hypothetical protein
MTTRNSKSGLLDGLPVFAELSYASFDLNRLAVFTIHWLEQHRITTSFENIVVATFRMFPAKFALDGYSQYPDAARVNRALLQLRPKYRNWARGSVQKGFVLTQSGLAEVARVSEALQGLREAEQISPRRKSLKPRTMDLSPDLQQLQRSALFAKWRDGNISSGTLLEFLDMLNAYVYTPPRALKERVDSLYNKAEQVNDKTSMDFLLAVRKSFSHKLRD